MNAAGVWFCWLLGQRRRLWVVTLGPEEEASQDGDYCKADQHDDGCDCCRIDWIRQLGQAG